MRETGPLRSRLTCARALLAAGALIAGVSAAGAQRVTDTALVPPRIGRVGSLPQPLSPSDVALYRRVFASQSRGAMAEAAADLARVQDPLLVGHALADRYLGRFHRSTVEELRDWLTRFADHPGARDIHALLARRLPRGADPGPVPAAPRFEPRPDGSLPEEVEPAAQAVPRNPTVDNAVRQRAADNPAAALAQIDRTAGLAPDYAAQLRAEVAHGLFLQNRDEEALAAATSARGSRDVALAGYVGGLAAWRLGRYETARGLFETSARAEHASPALRAAAAFWAARANLATRRPQAYVPWMTEAAREPRTLHGLLARRLLGQTPRFTWQQETLSAADADLLLEQPSGRRALALVQVGQLARADAEFRALFPQESGRAPLQRAVLLAASAAGLTDLAAQLAVQVQAQDGRARDYARFPIPRLIPRDGFRVDPALIYALTRLESNFDPTARSPAGARGLMQLMPGTASYIAGDPSLAGANLARLHDPALNLEIGQRYVWYLARHDAVGGDLIRLLAAYNSGPGGLLRWAPQVRHQDDPLIFLEAIPVHETRLFVSRALTYSWIYATRLGLPTTSLDELAAGRWPRYRQPQALAAVN